MGSWEESCIITGLPIREGDKVMALVTFDAEPKPKRHFYPVQDPVPVALPVVAEYADYGGIANVEETLCTTLFRKALFLDEDFVIEETNFLNPVEAMAPAKSESGDAYYANKKMSTSLKLIRADVYDYLSQNDLTSYNDPFVTSMMETIDPFLTTIQENYHKHISLENDDAAIMTRCMLSVDGLDYLWRLSEETRSMAFYVFARGQETGYFRDQWRIYEAWMLKQIEAETLADNVDAKELCRELIHFYQLTLNMYELGLTFDPGGRGPQHKSYEPHIKFLSFLLEQARSGQKADELLYGGDY